MTRMNKRYKKAYKFYQKELSNFKFVMQDTNNNLITANQYDYNCMSYAFGVFDNWMLIDAFEMSVDKGAAYMEYVFTNCCKELEELYPIRRLKDHTSEIAENERMIAFRIGLDDFHFARRNSDGTWTHKPGKNYIREIAESELLAESWSKETRTYPYISEIAFYAVTAPLNKSLN